MFHRIKQVQVLKCRTQSNPSLIMLTAVYLRPLCLAGFSLSTSLENISLLTVLRHPFHLSWVISFRASVNRLTSAGLAISGGTDGPQADVEEKKTFSLA